jgi:hypothetical protein
MSEWEYSSLFLQHPNWFRPVTMYMDNFNLMGLYSDQKVTIPHLLGLEAILHPKHTWTKLYNYDYICKIEHQYVLVMDMHSDVKRKFVVFSQNYEVQDKMQQYSTLLKSSQYTPIPHSFYHVWQNDFIANFLSNYMVHFTNLDGNNTQSNFSTPCKLSVLASDALTLDYFKKRLDLIVRMKKQAAILKARRQRQRLQNSVERQDNYIKESQSLLKQYEEVKSLKVLNTESSALGEFQKLSQDQKFKIRQVTEFIPMLIYFFPFMTCTERRFTVSMKTLQQIRYYVH